MRSIAVKRSWLLLAGLVAPLAFGADTSIAPPATTVEVLRPKYEAILKDINSRFDTDSAQLPPKYLKAVDALQMEARSKGDLQGVVAARKESTQFALANTLPAEDEADLAPDIKALRAKYRQQTQQLTARRDKDIVALVQQYCERLTALEKQLTKDGKIDAALAIHAENERAKTSKEAQAAILATYTEPSGAAKPEVPAKPTPPPVGGLAATLGTGSVAAFEFTDGEVRERTELLNRLVKVLSGRGVKTRVTADRLGVQSVSYDQGVPHYRCRYVPSYEATGRTRTYALAEATPLAVLETACAFLGVGYKLDAANNEVVLLDATAPAAEWTADTTAPEQIQRELATVDGRKNHHGKTIVVAGSPASTLLALGDLSLTLTNRVRLVFQKTPASVGKLKEVRAQCAEAAKANRDSSYERRSVELTAIGKISTLSTPLQLVVEDCLLIEDYSNTTYGHNGSSGRRIIRIDEHPSTRGIRRIGE